MRLLARLQYEPESCASWYAIFRQSPKLQPLPEFLAYWYETTSIDYAAQAEAMLIDYARSQHPATNTAPGMVPTDLAQFFYVYFLLDRG